MHRLLASIIALISILIPGLNNGMESLVAMTIIEAILLSMIWYPEYWVNYVLTTGFWQYFASDFKDSAKHTNAMIILGWTGLLLMLLLVLINGRN